MKQLKTNFPHADRCVVAASGMSNSHACDEGKINYHAYKHNQRTDRPVKADVKIGLGTEPMKMNRDNSEVKGNVNSTVSHEHYQMSKHHMNYFRCDTNPNVKRYE